MDLHEPFTLDVPGVGMALPVLVHVPHAGTAIPAEVRQRILLDDRALADELRVMTDHATDAMSNGVMAAGAYRFVNHLSRLVVDPERFTDGTEPMERVGMGPVYTRTSDGRPLRELDEHERESMLNRWFRPYEQALAVAVRDVANRAGTCTIIDLHSYPSTPLPYEFEPAWPRPDVCIGTDVFHTSPSLVNVVTAACDAHGLAYALDVPCTGAYTPHWAFAMDVRVQSVMLEIRRDLYLDENTARPHDGLAALARFVDDVVHGLRSATSA